VQAFIELKKFVFATHVLRGQNWSLSFHIATYASNTVVGAMWGQLEDRKPYGIYYISKNLSLDELNYK